MFRSFLTFFLLYGLIVGFAQGPQVKNIKIEGTRKTKPQFLKSMVRSEAGTTLDSVLIERDVQRLKRLPSISNAEVEVIMISDSICDLRFSVVENFTIIPFANIYTSTNEKFAFRMGLQEFNLLGKNITAGGFYQYDNYSSYGLQLRAPYLFSRRFGLSIDYKDFTTLEPVFFEGINNESNADYRYNNKGVEVLGLYEFDFMNRIELGFSFFNETYAYVSGAVSPQVPQGLSVDKHLIKLIYNFDNLNYFYQYLEGFRSTLNFQYVGTTDNILPAFLIGFNDFLYFHRIGKKGNWANRLRLGLASNVETPFAPFTVDNNLNIRGVGNIIDRGTGAIVFNTEYRHTLVDKDWFVLQGNAFIDGGSWRNPGGDFGDFAESRNIRIYPGVGLRFMHKRIFNAIFRIDYGYGVTKNASRGFVFGIGQYF